MHVLETVDAAKSYPRGDVVVAALDRVSVHVEPGQAVAVTGPSGAGKSTLLHLLGAMDRPTSGSVLVLGHDTAAMSDTELTELRRRSLGFVFQFFHLLPSLTAIDNVAVPVLLDGRRASKARADARAALASVGLEHRAEHAPAELSGGELQRVAIARALVNQPDVVLADEPTGNLDTGTSTEVLDVLRAATVDSGRALVLVTHDETVASSADRVVTIRDGRLEDGPVR